MYTYNTWAHNMSLHKVSNFTNTVMYSRINEITKYCKQYVLYIHNALT